MNEFRHGLLVGKFYPPHLGHHQAIRAAAARCDAFTVLVMASAVETVPLADRVAWMREEHAGDANVRVAGIRCDAPMDVTDQRVWAAQVAVMRAGIGGVAVDAVFSGDDYCVELARWFDAKAVRLERAGSSTSVRRDLAGRWDQLATPTRAGLTTRVVVLGAESTGTTTIARRLAAHYAARGGVWSATQCVEEYGRDYTALKWAGNPGVRLDEMVWTAEDFDLIGPEQTRREQAAARAGSPVLICDTDAFATAIWKRRYLGDPSGGAWTAVPPRAVYLVTDHVGVPWDDDGMREGDLAVRAAMTGWFIDALTGAGHSWVLLTGTPEQRLDVAFRTVEPLLQLRARFGEPLRGPGFEATE
ncbi:AAA family ATPase [Mycolicibacterium frederiksbergense]|uniref:Transcriptional regulator n=1 Tax=Mycolicibacterium frederiksbergense TaxID=117567 RepID=A0A6H0RYV8_9MYCO|nr:AAA family ATPase [Mycolicibacterium frederiksbergense]QIV80383.1 transcriptional regulator [Mycolicibacterium frederiksbergense]